MTASDDDIENLLNTIKMFRFGNDVAKLLKELGFSDKTALTFWKTVTIIIVLNNINKHAVALIANNYS